MANLNIIETSSPLDKKIFISGIERLKKMKINFKIPGKKEKYFFTFSPKMKFEELKRAVLDDDFEFLLAERGGAGAIHLIPFLKDLKIKKRKVLIGSSDLTYLGLYFLESFNFPFCYGPMLSDLGRDDFSKIEEKYFTDILNKKHFIYKNIKGVRFFKKGKGEGRIFGGNLTLFVSMLSFFKFSSFKGKILFLEDVNEPLYKIDRNLFILKMKGIFDEINGIIFGKMSKCFLESSKKEFLKIINEYFKDKNYPVVLFFPSGHSKPNLPLWIGGNCFIDSNKKIIESRFSYD